MAETSLPTSVDWRANIGTRFWARLVDQLVLALPLGFLIIAYGEVAGGRVDTPLWVDVATFSIVAVYEIGFVAMTGQTLGKRLLKIQVVDVATGRPPGLGGATIRHLVAGIPAQLPGVGPVLGLLVYLSAVWSPTRQGWHDRAAGTVVVRTAARQAITGGWADPSPEQPPHQP